MKPEELLRAGRPNDALAALQDEVRAHPSDPKRRVFLFQLLGVLGQWERALTQLNVAADLDAANLLMAQMCRPALACEALRREVFEGKRTPLVFGQPAEWVGWLIESDRLAAEGHLGPAQTLREQAFEAAPAVPGAIDDQPFQWIADADPRLGPMLEAIIDGRYYWVPFQNVRELAIEKPADLRDLIWAPAHFSWVNGGYSVGLIPSRYPGSESSPDEAVVMARRTEWLDRGAGLYVGLGQRLFATDQGEYPLLATRHIRLDHPAAPTESPSTEATHG